MQNAVVKYSIIFLLLLLYLNRGVFVVPYEVENHSNKEINSVVEWVLQLVTEESNDIDEDGDLQTDCSFTPVFIHEFPPQFTQLNLFPKEVKKTVFPYKDNFFLNDFYSQIEKPPETI